MKVKALAHGAAALVLILAGCSRQAAPAVETAEAAVEKTTKRVMTLRGEKEIPGDPQRIADASGLSDVLYLIGRKPVATSDSDAYDWSRFPSYLAPILEGAAIIGYPMGDTVDLERVLAAAPDLIIINPRQEKALEQLEAIAPVIVLEPDVNDWRGDMRMVGELFDARDAVERYIAEYEAEARAAGERIRARNGAEATYFAFLTGGSTYYLFTGAAYGDILYHDMGLAVPENLPAQDSITLPVATLEGLTAIDADYLVALASDEDRAALERSALWRAVPAVAAGRVIWLPQSPYFNQAYSVYGKKLLLAELEALLCP